MCSYTSEVEVWNCPSGHTKLADCLEGSLGYSCCNPCRSYNTVTTIRPCSNGPQGGGITPNDPGGNGGGEGGGGEFETNLPLANQNNDTPCAKIKLQRQDDEYNKRSDTLKANTSLKKETGYIQKWGGAYEYKDNANATSTSNTLSLPTVSSNTYIKGFTHTHVDDYTITNADGNIVERKGIKMFSPADVSYFMAIIQNAQNLGKTLNDSYAGMVTSTANYQIRFTGNQYQIKTFTDQQLIKHQNDFAKFMKAFMNNPAKLELKFLQYISEKMNLKGISLYRLNSDGTTTEIKLNAGKTDTVETTCP